jgi:hypothetical protein
MSTQIYCSLKITSSVETHVSLSDSVSFFFYSVSSLKKVRGYIMIHDTTLRHIIPIQSQPVFALCSSVSLHKQQEQFHNQHQTANLQLIIHFNFGGFTR